MSDPVVDVVVAIHDPRRRLDRALASLDDPQRRARITVVAHGIGADAVASMVPNGRDDVRVVEFADGVRSPAGPFNHGLGLATGEYVMIMGSDDYLEVQALPTWLDAVNSSDADIQLAPLRHQRGELLDNPLTRPHRRSHLDPVRDRLFHRTAPLGLIRRSLVDEPGPLTEGFAVGEDLAWSSRLWTSGARIDFDRGHPAYIIGADAAERVTTAPRPVTEVLQPIDALLESSWATRQPAPVRAALVAKLARVNILGAMHARPDASAWSEEARHAISGALVTLAQYAPRGFDDLPRSARDLLDVVASDSASADDIAQAQRRYRTSGRIDRLMPRRFTRALGRESVLRRYARYALDRRS